MKSHYGKKMPQMVRDNSVLGRAVRYLKSLGTKPEKIVATLAERGIKGIRGDMLHCPISRALKAQLNRQVVVEGRKLRWTDAKGKRQSCRLPMPCRRVIDSFDQGAYPQLEEV